jgi:hypothetical protein
MSATPAPDRADLIAKALACDWDDQEKNHFELKGRADLAKKLATDIKQARGRLVGVLEIAVGEKALDMGSKASAFGSRKQFSASIITSDEKAALTKACAILHRLDGDIERASMNLARLHKQREAEDKARLLASRDALDKALFNSLDRRGEILFMAAMHPKSNGYGAWADLIDAATGKGRLYVAAPEALARAKAEEYSSLARRIADTAKETGQSASALADGVAEKYRHPDTEEKFGKIADQVVAFLVAEQLASANQNTAKEIQK